MGFRRHDDPADDQHTVPGQGQRSRAAIGAAARRGRNQRLYKSGERVRENDDALSVTDSFDHWHCQQ